MDTIFFGFTALSLILLGIGLIKPHWVLPLSVLEPKTRRKAAIIYFVVFLTCLGIASKLSYQ
ncbi:hypothetical protein [Phascolarctobacterium sp.]|uniref:hypothetical protein n=1 Tax=Phascolarctobacterium sp. TaxID=2049039 RepID=UPI0015A86A69|nr:hypothetical protein [uncultured Phascolarctobacterium sp.]